MGNHQCLWGGAGFSPSLSGQSHCRRHPKSPSDFGNAGDFVNVTCWGDGNRVLQRQFKCSGISRGKKYGNLVMTFWSPGPGFFFFHSRLAVLDLHS